VFLALHFETPTTYSTSEGKPKSMPGQAVPARLILVAASPGLRLRSMGEGMSEYTRALRAFERQVHSCPSGSSRHGHGDPVAHDEHGTRHPGQPGRPNSIEDFLGWPDMLRGKYGSPERIAQEAALRMQAAGVSDEEIADILEGAM